MKNKYGSMGGMGVWGYGSMGVWGYGSEYGGMGV